MQSDIVFLQSTCIGGNQDGLFDLLLSHIDSLNNVGIFDTIQVIVPNPGMAMWLKDMVTQKTGICANLDFVVLLGPVLENIYLANNPGVELYDLNHTKYAIYDYLCNNPMNEADARELKEYIYINGQVDKFRVYQLACQLGQIFQEYIYLRTDELLNLKTANFPAWQKQILKHIFKNEQKLFLDIYTFFDQANPEALKLPQQLFIFGLTSIYPSQLQIIKKLAQKIKVYWYYQPCSSEYYGDLLSNYTKNKLEKKLLKQPELSLNDLYLTDGNQLLANLGQQSREFTELLQANDIAVYNFKPKPTKAAPLSMLNIIQEDIRQIKYRIRPEYRLGQNGDYYADPLHMSADTAKIIDLPYNQTSIKINICHNRMREVQVMFNEIANILNTNPNTSLDKILITAPNIDDYAAYITAVFDNEFLQRADGVRHKILYNITGNRRDKDYKALDTIKLLINAPYSLNVNYFVEILIQVSADLDISLTEIDRVKQWLQDNAIHFGYNDADYTPYGYIDYPVHSFKQWLNNMVLGACLPNAIFSANGQLPVYSNDYGKFCPYDNIDNSQIELCNKMLSLVELLEDLRREFYLDENSYNELTIARVHSILTKLQDGLIHIADSVLISEKFLGMLLAIHVETPLNLPIINSIIDEYTDCFKSKINFNGKITCASMQYMRNIPFDYTYILGMNFAEFPKAFSQNQLSILARQWYLADRNYNIEDKQTFLDIVLSAKTALYMSYIGRRETDNSVIKPSTALSLFISVLGQSFSDFENENGQLDFKNIMLWQSLHPFYNNPQDNFSILWHKVAKNTGEDYQDRRWDFSKLSALKLSAEQKANYYNPELKNFIATFLYSNKNLYSVLGIQTFDDEYKLEDNESLTLASRSLARSVYRFFEQYMAKNTLSALHEFLAVKGVLGYAHIGQMQFDYYAKIYKIYVEKRGTRQEELNFCYTVTKPGSDPITINLSGMVWLEDKSIIITPDFATIADKPLAEKLSQLAYELKISALIIYLLTKNGATLGDNAIVADTVIIRQINSSGASRDFLIGVNDISLIKQIFAYYLRSLSNPLLIHKNAILAYADAIKLQGNDGSLKYTAAEALNMARAKYQDLFNYNPDLDKIKQDIIFANINTAYFDYIDNAKGINDIKYIGEIVAALNGKL